MVFFIVSFGIIFISISIVIVLRKQAYTANKAGKREEEETQENDQEESLSII